MVNKHWIGYLLAGWLLLSSLIVLFYAARYEHIYKQNVAMVTDNARLQLAYTQNQIHKTDVKLDTLIDLLGKSRALYRFAFQSDTVNRHLVEELWLSFPASQHEIDQITYIDLQGQEQIKVSFAPDGTDIVEHDYQDVSQSDFFQKALHRLGMYQNIRRFELSRKGDEYMAFVRITHPYYIGDTLMGYLTLRINFEATQDGLTFFQDHEYITSIISSSGYYLKGQDASMLYGFAIQERKQFNLGKMEPELWQNMQDNESGVFLSRDGSLHVFSRVRVNYTEEIFLLQSFSETELSAHVEEERSSAIQHAIVMLILLGLCTIPTGYLIFIFQKRSIESKLALAALNGMSAVLITDKNHHMVKVNREFENMTGYTEHQIRYGNVRKLLFDKRDPTGWFDIWEHVAKDHFWEGELKITGRAGVELTAITRIQAMCNSDGHIVNYIISLVDITERKELEDRLRYLSERDSMTHLWNRRKFEEALRSEIDLIKRYPENHVSCLALVDIDNFKRINDEHGHDEGDRVIKLVSFLLSENTRSTDFVARIGGEEFAVIMPHTGLDEAERVLNRIRSSIATDTRIPTTISIGVTDLTEEGTRSYKCADIALYESKSIGRNRVSICRSSDDIA
ncbi:diguanylate cyclase [Vibrio sp. HA2012]|uniref:GGDEF domain-containing protein n=1 Tax=Vibrio sp. HA2012 TaxID=1971595 RepID=UPI000C2BD6E7|nr:diguanylate cyclase [Vibrio sp. HA2012]PJC85833.1 diguanylate cyclase [Vibrio sp. HA2012]